MTLIHFDKRWFSKKWKRVKSNIGKQYSADLNIPLQQASYFEVLVRENSFPDGLNKIISDLQKKIKTADLKSLIVGASYSSLDIKSFRIKLNEAKSNLRILARQLTSIKSAPSFSGPIASLADARRLLEPALNVLRAKMTEEDRLPYPKERPAARVFGIFDELDDALQRVQTYLENPRCDLVNNPSLLLLGDAGTGKTHLLCDMVEKHLNKGKPALLFLGREFQSPFTDLVTSLMNSIGISSDPIQFLSQLNSYALKMKTRCLICIDAINEGHHDSWKRNVAKLVETFAPFKGLALVLSCRIPFQQLMIPDADKSRMVSLRHFGFPPEKQLDAISKYFKFYKIPLPEVPLMEEEFSNPLFLKLFCESLEEVTQKDKSDQIKEIAAGQRGMTRILESFVDEKDAKIAKQLKYRKKKPSVCWEALKNGIAPIMAEKHSGIIKLDEAIRAVDAFQPQGMDSGALLRAMVVEDILAEDVIFHDGIHTEGIRFSYQKFGDHLIARYLFSKQLDCRDKRKIRKSLNDPLALGAYFKDSQSLLRNANIIQALIVEFPERTANKGELLDYIDMKDLPGDLVKAFIEGLYWRDPKNINRSTGVWIGKLLCSQFHEEVLNLLLALAVKPKHRFNASLLDSYLSRFPLIKRDRFWSEYLRNNHQRGTPERILIWIENARAEFSVDFAHAYCMTLKWFLTSTDRRFRDRSTRALFLLGLQHPGVLFRHAIGSLESNDPYVWERMLAAAYGVAMAIWNSDVEATRDVLSAYAKRLFKEVFAEESPHGTTHILARDYARHTIELALRVTPDLLSETEKGLINPPFKKGGIRRWLTAEDRDKDKYRDGDAPLHMDFENYTLGRLVPNRTSYQNDVPEYQKVKGQILWRIYKLGYRLELFSEIDKDIARSSFYREFRGNEAGKVDRYGKKYSWIAFYELAGHRQDRRLLPQQLWETHVSDRISDTDIDPSFPQKSPYPTVFKSKLIRHAGSVSGWMKSGLKPDIKPYLTVDKIGDHRGPWLLLEGHVSQLSGMKEVFIFLRGFFISQDDAERAKEVFSSVRYPGNRLLPELGEHYHSYAGEFPWADTWKNHQPDYIEDETRKTKVQVTIPVCLYAWQGSYLDPKDGRAKFPSKDIAETLRLRLPVPSVDLVETGNGKIASIFTSKDESDHNNRESLCFIRRDLFDRYLDDKGLAFILYAWGERQRNYRKLGFAGRADYEIEDILHKQAFIYQNKRFERFLG